MDFYLVSEAVCHWLLSFRDDVLRTLQETGGVKAVVVATPLCLHNQLWLAERVWGGGVWRDCLVDDAIAGAEAVRLRK